MRLEATTRQASKRALYIVKLLFCPSLSATVSLFFFPHRGYEEFFGSPSAVSRSSPAMLLPPIDSQPCWLSNFDDPCHPPLCRWPEIGSVPKWPSLFFAAGTSFGTVLDTVGTAMSRRIDCRQSLTPLWPRSPPATFDQIFGHHLWGQFWPIAAPITGTVITLITTIATVHAGTLPTDDWYQPLYQIPSVFGPNSDRPSSSLLSPATRYIRQVVAELFRPLAGLEASLIDGTCSEPDSYCRASFPAASGHCSLHHHHLCLRRQQLYRH